MIIKELLLILFSKHLCACNFITQTQHTADSFFMEPIKIEKDFLEILWYILVCYNYFRFKTAQRMKYVKR